MTATIPLVLLGPGRVGRALLELVLTRRDDVYRRLGARLEVMALGDSSGILLSPSVGLSEAALREAISRKSAGAALAAWPDDLHGAVSVPSLDGQEVEISDLAPVLIDTTAADTTATLRDARARGWRLVLANKVPLTGPLAAFHDITRHGVGARWESTVASSLPVVQVLQTILDSGDEVLRVSGTLSGSLGFILGALERGEPFSAAVRRAVAMGLAEPDPRNDLGGGDVARKALILARMLGYKLELDRVGVEGLVPAGFETGDASTFLARLGELDASYAARARSGAGEALRYLATVGEGEARARLVSLDRLSPMATGDAASSVVVFETRAYRHPLAVSGRAPGPTGAAMGVFADVVSLCRESLSAGIPLR